ncbi:MAG: glucose-6-phosphate dehydrogenase [Lentisphaeria bacterium]|nr:glucose-6-phosphate dehydrogenase [Lentisphaeria bacterium]
MDVAPMPAVVIIFGATGDLAQRKLFPALRNLHKRKMLNESSRIIACGRREYDDDTFRQMLGGDAAFLDHVSYCRGDNADDAIYQKLQNMIEEFSAECGSPCNKLFYLALASDDMLNVCRKLSEHGLTSNEENGAWAHVVFEKPFGHDLESAKMLNNGLHKYLAEDQIYRIDHYLGKETVQNILMLRFANVIFEPLWRSEYISHVEITAAEEIGIEQRGKYYDHSGALRDMFQNHMLQLLCLMAMEAPTSFAADAVRNEKTKLLQSIRPFALDKLDEYFVRGQYIGYRDEKNVNPNSGTETYVAAKFLIDNWRWRGVPFYLRSGKRLTNKKSEIAVTFKNIPHSIFQGISPETLGGNTLVLNIYPTEGIDLSIQAKKPGPKLCIGRMTLNVNYSSLGKAHTDDAYERLLLDALKGDSTLFIRNDFIEEAWKLLTPVLNLWQNDSHSLEFYHPGSAGPAGADKLIEPASWRSLN